MDISSNHITVLLNECVDALLAAQQSGVYVDATFGRGGHSRLLLSKMDANSRLIAFDKDPEACTIGQALAASDSRFTMVYGSFANLSQQLEALNLAAPMGIMADLGVSSPQLDNAERGFSFMHDGPLDMRMDNQNGLSAADWLAQVDQETLANVLYNYGEERYSRRIAAAIKQAMPLSGTLALANVIKQAHPNWDKRKHPATRSFQAIRIAINKELADLEAFLPQARDRLAADGRLAVISFHSLEDRMVKQFIQTHSTNQLDPWGNVLANGHKTLQKIARIAPGESEIALNTRARSAWLRVAQKLPAKH
jgi:16S rRNA (cytosine1402-N4)-methyltransferase